jgi:hypothetical protein
MKKLIQTLILVIFIFACTQKKEGESLEQPSSELLPIEPIPFTEAVDLIYNFLQIPEYQALAKSAAIGGAFDINSFRVPPDKEGVLFWFCKNKSNNNYPEFFLALEHITGYDTTTAVLSPKGGTQSPDYIFQYTNQDISKPAIGKFLKTHNQPNQATGKPLSLITTTEFIEEFRLDVKNNGRCTTDNCKYPESYFDGTEGNYLNTFLNYNPVMIRYYFGYDKKYYKNSIRVILIGTDSTGMNIFSATFNDGSILQRSWPPPPQQ